MSDILRRIMEAITVNEIGGDLSLAYRFSDADGVRTGKSGYSFGRSQFDIENNWTAILCLKDCGFTPKELDRLFEQSGDISDLDRKLKLAAAVVDRYDEEHIAESVRHVARLINGSGIVLADEETFAHLVDYHNQLYLTPGGKLHTWLKDLHRMVTAEDILGFKLDNTAWGRKKPEDVQRRFNNIHRIMNRDI